MSECIVPSWNLSHQRQQVAGEEGNRTSSHVHNQPHPAYVVPMSNYEVAELTWENGQLAMHGLAGIVPAPAGAAAAGGKVPTFVRTGGTLESIVHQATCYKNNEKTTQNQLQETAADLQGQTNPIAAAATSILDGKRVQNTAGNIQLSPPGKRLRSSESDQCGKYSFNGSKIKGLHEDQVVASGAGSAAAAAAEKSGCASASATFCRDATMMTWNSFESPGSFKTKTTDEDSACHDGSENRDEDLETKEETFRSHSARRSRAAMIHNQSERRRRDRINQKMKALQKLVPNANKTDKASMLDEVIEYLKQLQTQVHMMSTRTMPQMMMNPLAIQQHQQQQLQMSLLARMGMGVGLGMGMGMLDMNAALARSTSSPFQSGLIPTAPVTPTFVPPHFVVPATAVPTCAPSQAKSPVETTTNTTSSVPFSNPYAIYLAQQSMNMEFYNKMADLYRQQATNQATQATSNQPQENFIQRE